MLAAALGCTTGCAPVGQRYQLLPAPPGIHAPQPLSIRELVFPGHRISAAGALSEFVFTESPLGGVYYGAWNSCVAERDETFYEGFRRGATLELQPLGRYPEVRPYCGFSLTTDGDNILVFGGSTRRGAGLFRPALLSQVLVLDPERGTARRLSPPRGFTRRLSLVFFHRELGAYILMDHRGSAYRLRLP